MEKLHTTLTNGKCFPFLPPSNKGCLASETAFGAAFDAASDVVFEECVLSCEVCFVIIVVSSACSLVFSSSEEKCEKSRKLTNVKQQFRLRNYYKNRGTLIRSLKYCPHVT